MSRDVPAWVADAVFYQIFPDRFARGQPPPDSAIVPALEPWDSPPTVYGFKGGDLWGVTERLDYLQELGVTALYLNPVFASAANHRYHTYDYFQVDPLLGGNAALQQLLQEAHRRGLRIVLDGVFNHASRGFWQFHHVLENGSSSPYRDWFYFDPARLQGRRPFLPYPDEQTEAALRQGAGSFETVGYAAWWNLPALPKFNVRTPAVRDFLLSVAEHWIRFGIDGWRLDVPNEIDDDEFWREFRRRVRAVNPEAYIVGEVWGDGSRWLQGDMWDAVINYRMTAACLGFFGGPRLNLQEARRPSGFCDIRRLTAAEFSAELQRLEGAHPAAANQCQLNVLDSHDMPRFLTCVQGDVASLQLAWLLLCTLPGTPCIFYGDEIGLAGSHDPDCRRSFPWDTRVWNMSLRDWYRQCLLLRKQHPALRYGSRRTLIAEDGIYAALQQHDEDRILTVFNTLDTQQTVSLVVAQPDFGVAGWRQWPDGATLSVTAGAAALQLTVPARSALAAVTER